MGSYFKPWRRKIGVVTLVMACVFMAGWVRGFAVEDVWQPKYGETVGKYQEDTVQHHFRSSRYGITWRRLEGLNGTKFGWRAGWSTNSASEAAQIEGKIIGDIKWRWRWAGFDFCDSETDDTRHSRRRIPYWSIVTPLTLLSAWLLLSNPRTKPSELQNRLPNPAPKSQRDHV